MIELPFDAGKFQDLVNAAFSEWITTDAFVKLTPLRPGFSGAALFRADIRTKAGERIESGQYFLKLSEQPRWADQDTEINAHRRAYSFDE